MKKTGYILSFIHSPRIFKCVKNAVVCCKQCLDKPKNFVYMSCSCRDGKFHERVTNSATVEVEVSIIHVVKVFN